MLSRGNQSIRPTPELVARLLVEKQRILRTQEDMQQRITQRDQRSEALTKQLARRDAEAAKRDAEVAAAKERADANDRHMKRLADAHALLHKSHARVRTGESKLESVSAAHLDALEKLEASKEQTASARAEAARAGAESRTMSDSLHAERAARALADERLERARHDALTQQQVLVAAQARAEKDAQHAEQRREGAERERERVSQSIELANARLVEALAHLEEERARRMREEERAAAREATLLAECTAAKQAAREATGQWEYAVLEATATRADLEATRGQLLACRRQLEEAERLMSERWEAQGAQLREAQEEIEWLEGERRKLVAETGDAQAENLRLEIELQGMQHADADARLLTSPVAQHARLKISSGHRGTGYVVPLD
jgi:hypothetical protein